jgi:uncharacterized protein YhjY with autotransporter beta-barrel domain
MSIAITSLLRRFAVSALATLAFIICFSQPSARAADIQHEVYSGESIRIVVNTYGQSAIGYDYPNGNVHGTLTMAPDVSGDLIYTSSAGFVGTDVVKTTAYTDPVTWTAVGSDTHYITVKPRITFSASNWPNAKKGEVYSQSVTATYSASSTVVTYSVLDGSLPPGLSLDGSNGTISGTPTATGSWTFTYQALNADGYSSSQSMTLKVGPSATNHSMTVAANSSNNAVAFTVSGTEQVSAVSSAAHGTTSLSGSTGAYSPTAGYSGSDSFTCTVTDSASGLSSTATVFVTVTQPTLAIAPSALPDGVVGQSYSATLSASLGGPLDRFSVQSGSLPAGLTLTDGGVLSGTPTQHGTSSFTVIVQDIYGATGTQSYDLVVAIAPPVAGSVNATVAANSTNNSITLSLSGGAASSVAVASAASHGTATASGTTITYTPTAGYSGSDSFTYTATNASGTSTAATVTVTVTAPTVAISLSTLPAGTAAVAYSQTLTAANGTAPYTFAVTSGSLPAGLTLSTGGTLSGTPTTAESQTFTVTATDHYGATGDQSYTLAIAIAAPVAGDVTTTVAANSSSNSVALSLTGGTTSTVAIASAPGHGTATASGTSITYAPTAGYSGVDTFTYTATNASGTSAPATVTVTVTQPTLVISPTGTLTLRAGEAFSQTFSAANGTAPYNYSMTGTLPDGLIFDPSSGTLSGTPTENGSFSLTVTATDAYGASTSANVTLSIDEALPVAPTVTTATASGSTVTIDLTDGATGGPFTGATLVSLSPPSAGTAIITLGDTAASSGPAAFAAAMTSGRYRLQFKANPTYTGTAVATYTLTSAAGTSAPASVTLLVSARPVLNDDADMVGLVRAQATAAKRLAESQIDNVADHMKSLRGKVCLENSLSVALGDDGGGAAPVSANAGCSPIANGDLAFWTAGSISLGDSESLDGESAFDYATVALTGGLDHRLTDTVIGGVAIGYSRDRTNIGSNGTTSRNSAMSATLYALYQPGGGFFVDGLAGVGLLDFDSLRITAANGAEAEAERTGRQVFAALTGGYDLKGGDLSLSTYGRLSGSRSVLDSVTETGADWENALLGRQEIDSLTATLGLSVGYDIDIDDLIVTPELTLDFSHDFLDSSETVVTYAEDGWPIDYVIPGESSSRSRVTVGLGVTVASGRAATLRGRYSATIDPGGLQSQRFSLDLSRQF